MRRTRARAWLFAMVAAGVGGLAGPVFAAVAEPGLVLVQTAPGRVEVAAQDASVAHTVAAAAEEGWRVLSGPFGLPDAFTSPLFVRVSANVRRDEPAFRAVVEPGGVVTVRVTTEAIHGPMLRRALTHGLLLRMAVALHGANQRLTVPLWLEQGGAAWWETRAQAAQLDAWKQESTRMPVAPLETLLYWRLGDEEPRDWIVGTLWLLTHLQAESGRGREWPTFFARILAGDEPLQALAAAYAGRFNSPDTRELWWQTGYHAARRVRTLPALDVAESRDALAALARFVFAGATEDADIVVPLAVVLQRHTEPVVAAELGRRVVELRKLVPLLHPFFRNAGVSLGEALAVASSPPAKQPGLSAAFEQDWRDALELEGASTAALDRLEAQPKR